MKNCRYYHSYTSRIKTVVGKQSQGHEKNKVKLFILAIVFVSVKQIYCYRKRNVNVTVSLAIQRRAYIIEPI
jgi:hypothetical protein